MAKDLPQVYIDLDLIGFLLLRKLLILSEVHMDIRLFILPSFVGNFLDLLSWLVRQELHQAVLQIHLS